MRVIRDFSHKTWWMVVLSVAVIMISCAKEEVELQDEEQPQIVNMTLLSANNPEELSKDVVFEDHGDSLICHIPNLVSEKSFIVSFDIVGDYLCDQNGMRIYNGITSLDFSQPLTLTVCKGEKRKEYQAFVYSYTGLPTVYIETVDRKDITTKDNYVRASFVLKDLNYNLSTPYFETEVNIKGRGNSTWEFFDKKAFRLKFDEKYSFFDLPADKSWVLLANCADKTSLKNHVASYLGKISNLDYTPSFGFVDVFLNTKYHGLYQLGEKVKVSKHRVNVGDDGFLLEIDEKAKDDEITFRTEHLVHPVNIKEPDVSVGDANYEYVVDFVRKAENALYSGDFKNLNTGWQAYFDIESFTEWYVIQEIAKNTDSGLMNSLYTSCYMNLKHGGKLKMGPLWDFDIAFGGAWYMDSRPEGFWVKNTEWFSRLFEDPVFVAKVKERFNYFYSRKDDIIKEINKQANIIRYAVEEDENKWHQM